MPPTLGRVLGICSGLCRGCWGAPTVQCAAEPGARFRSAVPRCGSVSYRICRGRNIKTADTSCGHLYANNVVEQKKYLQEHLS